MTTVIIGGGSRLRAALDALECASLIMTDQQRTHAQKIVEAQADTLEAAAANPATL